MSEAAVAEAPAPANNNSDSSERVEQPSPEKEVADGARGAIASEITPTEWESFTASTLNRPSEARVFANNGQMDLTANDPLRASGEKPTLMTTDQARATVKDDPNAKVTDRPLVREHTGPLDYGQERDRLLQNIENMPADQRQKALENIARLEDQNNPERQPPLTQQELARLYKATSDLIENKDGKQPPTLNDGQRQLLASGILDNTANNRAIDQGYNNTCQVTSLEENMVTRDAAAYAEMMSDIGRNTVPAGQLHGRDVVAWTTPDGKQVLMDRNSLMPDQEARSRGDGGQRDGDRNYASQVFDMMTINQYWQSGGRNNLYTKDTPTRQGDTGERLINAQGQVVGDAPQLAADALSQVGTRLGLNAEGGPFMVTNSRADGRYNFEGVAQVASTQDMQQLLDNAQKNGGFPLTVMVHTGHESMRGSDSQGGSGGWHMVTITGPGDKPGTWNMSNQWGQRFETQVTTEQLYQATLGPELATSGYNGRGAIQGDGGGGTGGGGGGTDAGGGGTQKGVLNNEEFQKFKEQMDKMGDDKTGKEFNSFAEGRIAALQKEIDALRSVEGSEARLLSLQSELQLLSSQISK